MTDVVEPDFSLLPIGINDFEQIRRNKQLYVDKTQQIAEIAQDAQPKVLIRPQGFGKTLLLSTLHSLFEHGLQYFDGLYIQKHWTDTTYPVIHLDFALYKARNCDVLDGMMIQELRTITDRLGLKQPEVADFASEYLANILRQSSFCSLVLLIDNFDAPFAATQNNSELLKDLHISLQRFLSVIKSLGASLRFAMITETTDYTKGDIFGGGLDNAIYLIKEYTGSTLAGFTAQELTTFFAPFINRLAKAENMTPAAFRQHLKNSYGGHYFYMPNRDEVYDPQGVLGDLNLHDLLARVE